MTCVFVSHFVQFVKLCSVFLLSVVRRPTHSDREGKNLLHHISKYDREKLHDFAYLLLNDQDNKHVPSLEAPGNKKFLENVLKNWLSRDDNDKDDPAHPRTWKAFAYCLHEMHDELATLAHDLQKKYT